MDELELREEELALAEAKAELVLKKKEVMLEKARLAVRKRQTRRRREKAAARYEGESVYGCSSVPLHGGSELGVPSQISTAGSSHVFRPLWSKEKVPMPDEPDSMAKPIHFPQEFSSKHFKYGPTYTANDNMHRWVNSLPPSVVRYPNPLEEGGEQASKKNPHPSCQSAGGKSRSSRVSSDSCASALKKHLEKIAEKQAETLAQSLKESSLQQEQKLIWLAKES